jgi:hypothetical protein
MENSRMSDMTTADVAFLADARSETTWTEAADEPILPARHVVAAIVLLIGATVLALLVTSI